MKSRWREVDTREFGRNRDSAYDGFVHLVPCAMQVIHELSSRCWCNPRVIWPERGQTLIVSHKDKRPGRKGEVTKCPE